jgi:hypothetical protein
MLWRNGLWSFDIFGVSKPDDHLGYCPGSRAYRDPFSSEYATASQPDPQSCFTSTGTPERATKGRSTGEVAKYRRRVVHAFAEPRV